MTTRLWFIAGAIAALALGSLVIATATRTILKSAFLSELLNNVPSEVMHETEVRLEEIPAVQTVSAYHNNDPIMADVGVLLELRDGGRLNMCCFRRVPDARVVPFDIFQVGPWVLRPPLHIESDGSPRVSMGAQRLVMTPRSAIAHYEEIVAVVDKWPDCSATRNIHNPAHEYCKELESTERKRFAQQDH